MALASDATDVVQELVVNLDVTQYPEHFDRFIVVFRHVIAKQDVELLNFITKNVLDDIVSHCRHQVSGIDIRIN